MMDVVLNFFNQGWVGALIGIFGLMAAYVTYISSGIGSRLVYQWESLKIISKGDKVPVDIEIIYKGKSVPRLIKTRVVFWNSGKQTIKGEDIVQADPLKMVFSEGEEIVSANVTKVSRDINLFSYSLVEENKLNFEFDFLDPNDGAVLEILHTDNSRYPKITGTIKGMPQGILNLSRKKKGNKVNEKTLSIIKLIVNSRISHSVLLCIGVFFILSSLGFLTDSAFLNELITGKKSLSQNEKKVQAFNMAIIGGSYIFLGGSSIWNKRRRYPRTLNIESKDTIQY